MGYCKKKWARKEAKENEREEMVIGETIEGKQLTKKWLRGGKEGPNSKTRRVISTKGSCWRHIDSYASQVDSSISHVAYFATYYLAMC